MDFLREACESFEHLRIADENRYGFVEVCVELLKLAKISDQSPAHPRANEIDITRKGRARREVERV